jgi:putative restriction endonuclease
LSKSRRGQGLFRERTRQIEGRCRVTGIDNPSLLVASHMKPWARCNTNAERLDGNNGLMLTPTIDRLFDQGFISFENNGDLLISEELTSKERQVLGLEDSENLGLFNEGQIHYLNYHRTRILR